MTPSRPYLIRALYEWILDNGMTPYILVDAVQEGVQVPEAYVEDGKIVFNINASAVQNLLLGNDEVAFNARFGGQPHLVQVPVMAVLAIYARENGKGMVFAEEEHDEPEPPPGPDDDKPKKPTLRVVK